MGILIPKNTNFFGVLLKLFYLENQVNYLKKYCFLRKRIVVENIRLIINFINKATTEYKYVKQIYKINYHPPDT